MSIRRRRNLIKGQVDARRALLDGSKQGELRVATPYRPDALRRGVLTSAGQPTSMGFSADSRLLVQVKASDATVNSGAAQIRRVTWEANPSDTGGDNTIALDTAGYGDGYVIVDDEAFYSASAVIVFPAAASGWADVSLYFDVDGVSLPLQATHAFVGAGQQLVITVSGVYRLPAGGRIDVYVMQASGAAQTISGWLSVCRLSSVNHPAADPGTDGPAATGFYVAVGGGATTGTVQVATSPDGATWTERTTPFSGQLLSVTHNGSIYAAGNSTSPGEIGTSPDGITWTLQTNPFTSGINDIAWGGGLFVAVGGSGQLATSPDGITWTSRTSGFGTAQIMCVDYDETAALFVAAGASGQLATSPDGINWTARTSGFGTTTIEKVVHGSSLWVAVGFGKIGTSPDGISWTQRTHPLNTAIRAVSYGDGVYIAGAHAGRLATSPDGITWTERTTGLSGGIYGSSWAAGLFVVGTDAGELATSPDGIAWTVRTSPFPTTSSSVYEIVGVTT